MIYFSEIKGKEVFTEDRVEIGKLEDLIFVTSETPKITKLIIRDLNNNKLIVPIEFLSKLNSEVFIKKDFNVTELSENELFLVKNILDKQIIDLQGNKIVRVNDIVIQEKNGFYIAGVDVGFFGLLRWLKLEKLIAQVLNLFRVKLSSKFLSWADIQPLELARGQVKLKKVESKLEKLHPEDLADYLEKTNIINVRRILKMLEEKFAADVIGSLNINYQTALFKFFSPEKAAEVISLIDPDDAVDILLTVTSKKREQIISYLPETKKKEINHLLHLSSTAIGGLITTEYIAVLPDNTAREVINVIRNQSSDFFTLINIYVVNKNNQLMGVFNLHELLLQSLDTPVYKFMIQNVIVVHLTTPVEIALRKIFKYRLVHLPVIDDNKTMLGIIMVSDLTKYVLNKFQ